MDIYEFCESIGSSVLSTNYKRKNTMPTYKRSSVSNFSINAFLKEMSLMKLRFPFLKESQIQGRTLDKFGIPNIMGKPYKINSKCSVTIHSVSHMISTVRKSMIGRKSNENYSFEKRRNNIAGTYPPLDVITHKISRKGKSKASKNLQNVFTLYSEEIELSDDNYTIDSASEADSLREFTNENILTVLGSCTRFALEKPNESAQSIKTYERKRGNNLRLNCIFSQKNNKKMNQSDHSTHRINNTISKEDNVKVTLGNSLFQDDINDDIERENKIKHLNKKREMNLEKKLIPKQTNGLSNKDKFNKIIIMQTNQTKPFSKKNWENNSKGFIVTENEIMDGTTHNSDKNSLGEDLCKYDDVREEENLRYPVKDTSDNKGMKCNYSQYKKVNNKPRDLYHINNNDYEYQHSSDLKIDAPIDNTRHLNDESDEIIDSNEYRPVNQSQEINVKKLVHPNEIINSEVKKKRSINYLALKDNRLRKTTDTSQMYFINSDKQHFDKNAKKIKQSISINFSEHLLNSISTLRAIKMSQSESTMEEACTMELPSDKILKSCSEKELNSDKSQEEIKIPKKCSECIILIDGQMQTDSTFNLDHNFMIKDSVISSKGHSSTSESHPISSDGYYSENADTHSLTNANFHDDSLSQLSDESIIVANNDDNKTTHSPLSTEDGEMGVHLNLIQGNFSPAFVTTTHLLLNVCDDSTDGFETSQNTLGSPSNVSRIIPDALSGNAETVEINEEGYYLANLFDDHTNLPHRRTLRSTSLRELSSEKNDEALLVD